MKKCFTAIFLLFAGLYAHAYSPINQWWIFTGNYSYIDDNLIPDLNLGGSDIVNAVAEDQQGNIWMAVAGKGLRFYDGHKMMNPKIPKESIAFKADVLTLAFDSKNTLWIGTTEGLVEFDGTTWTNFGPEVIGMRAVKHIAITASDKVYISGMTTGPKELIGAGLAFFNGQAWSNFNKSNSAIPDDEVDDLLIDKNGHLWMTVAGREGGVAKFDGKNWKTFTTANSALPTNMVRAIATNSSGKLWFATPKGLVTFDGNNWEVQAFSNAFGTKLLSATGGTGNSIDALSLAVEDYGTIWMGARNQGVYCFRKSGTRVYTMEKTPLSGNSVHQILIDKTDRKWFVTGSYNQQWALQYPKENRTPYISNAIGVTAHKMYGKENDTKWTIFDETNAELNVGSTYSIVEDDKGNIWMPNTSDGLVMSKNGTYITYKHPGLMTAFDRMYLAPDGKIYLNTSVTGIKVFQNGDFSDFAKHPNMGGVTAMTYDKNGVLWASGMSGLSRYVNNDWETFNKKNGDLPSVIIYTVFKDSKGNLWAGTAKGLVKYDGTTWTFFTDKEVDFPSQDIRAITEDKNGRLWVGSKSGLSIYDGTNWTHISKLEGTKLNKITINSISIDQNGVAWMGTDLHGLLRYDGKTWTVYDKDNTGSMYDQITAVKAGSDGRIYVASEATSFDQSDFSMPSQAPTEAIRQSIHKKLKDSDPKRIIAIFQP